MWTERVKEDVVGRGKQHDFQRSSLLSQYGFTYIQKAKDQLKRKLIHAYEERDKPFEERAEFKELQDLSIKHTERRKRDKKRKEKKHKKKKHKRHRSSSSSSSQSNNQHSSNNSDN